MGGEGLGKAGRYGRPLGKHHATDPKWEEGLLPKWEEAIRNGSDPSVTRDETSGEDPHDIPGDPDRHARVADGHLKFDQFHHYMVEDARAMDARVVPGNTFPGRTRRLPRMDFWRMLDAFLRGFFMALGIMLGAGAGTIISGVVVLMLLAMFGQGQ